MLFKISTQLEMSRRRFSKSFKHYKTEFLEGLKSLKELPAVNPLTAAGSLE